MRKNDHDWREQLTSEQYYVCREGGTEAPFSGEYHNNSASGIYKCICCYQTLFDSNHQFDSECGWPSYTKPIASSVLSEYKDTRHGMRRTEVRCSQCDAHLGHVFPDGPSPEGLRYCINSVALSFESR